MIQFYIMKAKVLFLSSMICICGMVAAHASDCIDDECDFDDELYLVEEITPACSDCESDIPTIESHSLVDAIVAIAGKQDDKTEINQTAIDFNDGCPFETEMECDIWRSKPIIRETVAPRSPKIRNDKMFDFLSEINCTGNIDVNSVAAAPLIERYKMLMRTTNACCTEGMVYQLRRAGASDGLIYKYMSDDANFYNIGNRCLMTTDAELDEMYPETVTASVISDVRDGCLCRRREWFRNMLAPFVDAWNASPEFASSPFLWTYTDGLKRQITVSINDDVRKVLDRLETCP